MAVTHLCSEAYLLHDRHVPTHLSSDTRAHQLSDHQLSLSLCGSLVHYTVSHITTKCDAEVTLAQAYSAK